MWNPSSIQSPTCKREWDTSWYVLEILGLVGRAHWCSCLMKVSKGMWHVHTIWSLCYVGQSPSVRGHSQNNHFANVDHLWVLLFFLFRECPQPMDLTQGTTWVEPYRKPKDMQITRQKDKGSYIYHLQGEGVLYTYYRH